MKKVVALVTNPITGQNIFSDSQEIPDDVGDEFVQNIYLNLQQMYNPIIEVNIVEG